MKINSVLFFVVIAFASLAGCAKNSTDNAQPNNGSQNGGQSGNNQGNQPAAKDSGLVVVFTNTPMTDSIQVTINGALKGMLTPGLALQSGKPKYGDKRALNLKMPVGSITVNGLSSHNTSRASSGTVTKNDTTFVLLNYEYDDASKDDYYLQFTEELITSPQVAAVNTDLKIKLDPITSRWMFSRNAMQPTNSVYCSAPNPALFYDGISIVATLTQVPSTDKFVKWRRLSYFDLPIVGSYSNLDGVDYDTGISGNNGNCLVQVDDFVMECGRTKSIDGSGATVQITNVKIVEDLGLEKRGYYEGMFTAVLYKNSFSEPNVQLGLTGKFKVPIGGIK